MKPSGPTPAIRLLAAAFALGVAGCSSPEEGSDSPTDDATTVDPLTYHDGYWVGEQESSDLPISLTIINDMHIDLSTRRATVYAQMQALGQVLSPRRSVPCGSPA